MQQRGQNFCSQTLILMKQILTFDSVDKVEMCQKRDSHKASTEKNFVAILSLLSLDTGCRVYKYHGAIISFLW